MKNHDKITENTEFLEFIEDLLPISEIVNVALQQAKLETRKQRMAQERKNILQLGQIKRVGFDREQHAKMKMVSEEENPYKENKQASRPEFDPEDHDRNRKREDRRQDKQADIMSQVVIVTNNDNQKTMLILASDFDAKKHTLVLGRTNDEDKGSVSYDDIQNLTQDPSFMSTKTSDNLIGKIEKQQQENPQQDPGMQDPSMGGDPAQQQGILNPQSLIPKSQNGKDKIDPTSSYPDWDHTEQDLVAVLPDMFNMSLGAAANPMMQQAESQTLQKAALRIISTITQHNTELGSFIFTSGSQIPVNTNLMWFNSGLPSDAGSGQLVGQAQTGQTISIAVRLGPQKKLVTNNIDAKLSFISALRTLDPIYYSNVFKDLLKEIVEGYRNQKKMRDKAASQKMLVNPQFINPYPNPKSEIVTPDMELDQFERLKDNIRKKIQKSIVKLVNDSTSLKTNIIYEALSGKSKYADPLGKAQFLLSASLDGTNAKLIPLDMTYCRKVAKGRDTTLNIIFSDVIDPEMSILDKIVDAATEKAGTTISENKEGQSIAVDLEKIFNELQGDPIVMLEAFESDIENIVFVEPVYYSDYYSPVVTSYNTIEFNPGFSNEEEISVSVEDDEANKYNDAIENESQLMENYLFINDVLVDMVKSKKLTCEQALNTIREEFNVLNERVRDYKKEYRDYHGKPEQIKRRAGRVKARRKAMKQGRVKKGDGKDIHHKNGNPRDNGEDNLQVMSKHKNRSIKEEHGAGEQGTDQLRKQYVKDTPFMVDPVKFVKRFKKK